MTPIISIRDLTKTYANGFSALKGVSLDIEEGEILALLGPNGAGKTTMISIICGIVNPTSGVVTVGGHDVVKDFRQTRSMIGLVPQELTTDQFESVLNTVSFSRGIHGCKANPAHIEKVLKSLSLWDKRNSALRELSGGMKRRVLIAKALSHEPKVLFLDEPTAGVDVALRRDMWSLVSDLRREGVTIILTTHYIEEAEEIADRVGIVNKGELLLVEDKAKLMGKLGRKQMVLDLVEPLKSIPGRLDEWDLKLTSDGMQIVYDYQPDATPGSLMALLAALELSSIAVSDMASRQTSLEDIFVSMTGEKA
ncbi:ABC transporter ATP-binding protein [Allorhizobium terrae]|uniref:ABC transporter ATP-binding protein n=1 Tax=Allorhizobium terrae TaxID=1848972 RepID=A0A4S4A6K1_9HYPH|nr:ABC transporter ATP-binding protein [Allorhizobium terrae]THF53994.1 ABC transporter ATP-binding protein [Allorhizobium terrae]TWD58224.1 ABC-2 type transport system ATP-binding protein [Agrobacterium vitis]